MGNLSVPPPFANSAEWAVFTLDSAGLGILELKLEAREMPKLPLRDAHCANQLHLLERPLSPWHDQVFLSTHG